MVAKEPVKVAELSAEQRIKGFDEVVLGYSEEEALLEANRCLQCKNPTCISGCPVNIDIKKFIFQITKKDYAGAYFTIRQTNNFPSICGRVCPAEYQCRKSCVFNKSKLEYCSPQAINIHFLERFVGDYGMQHNLQVPIEKNPKLSKTKVAVIGSGPAGLCCAGELVRKGVKVTVFEGLQSCGGVLRYGIPSFRLPRKALDYEINYLAKLGVEFVTNVVVGKTILLEELFQQGFNKIFLGLGAGVPSFLGIKGESLCNVYSANEFLTRVNLMSAYKFPQYHTPVNIGKHVLVVGGGNTAMDAARCALRLQKMAGLEPDVTIIYRRTLTEMPARRLEIVHAQEEGIGFKFLTQPKEFYSDDKGFVRQLNCLVCQLQDTDASGRRKPIALEGSDFSIPCDLAIIAIGLGANQVLTSVTSELKTDKYKDIIINPVTMEASIKNVFAGGDIVGGEGTVIEAMGMAKKAAISILQNS
ncbi:MAG: NADPH-dependent glutamate synthase [Candidatus Omnitrophota bacterium]|nr:NADPH-dependent glutamate synthase [Candidatus Omnitrophota bacterium]